MKVVWLQNQCSCTTFLFMASFLFFSV